MLALGVALAVARVLYLNALPPEVLSRDAGGSIFDTLVRFLRYGLRTIAVLALVVALAAFFTGPSVSAARTRAALTKGIDALRGGAESAGLNTGRFGAWTFAHKRILRIASVVGGALVLTFWSRPTATVVVVTAVVVLLAVGVIEFLGRPPADSCHRRRPRPQCSRVRLSGCRPNRACRGRDRIRRHRSDDLCLGSSLRAVRAGGPDGPHRLPGGGGRSDRVQRPRHTYRGRRPQAARRGHPRLGALLGRRASPGSRPP